MGEKSRQDIADEIYQEMAVKFRIGQMNDPIFLIINSPNWAMKRPTWVLSEITLPGQIWCPWCASRVR
jgi:hypothetical protein